VRIGFGYDLHPLVRGRALILGGIDIPFEKGLDGHSDADVLCHSIADALLGAAALGDIGEYFPDTDMQYKDASSIDLLGRVNKVVRNAGYRIGNVDATVVAEAPRLAPYRQEMIEKIAEALDLEQDRVSVKATTHEGFGPPGRGEVIVAYAVIALEEIR
jgi:2-C-methyl-D-erythritol 2,4-cyclodiphosphate synthase